MKSKKWSIFLYYVHRQPKWVEVIEAGFNFGYGEFGNWISVIGTR